MPDSLVFEKCIEILLIGVVSFVGYVVVLNQLIHAPYSPFGKEEKVAKSIRSYAVMGLLEEAISRYFPLRITAQLTDNNVSALIVVTIACSLLFGWAHSGAIHVENFSVRFEPYGKSPLWKYLAFQGVGGLIFSAVLLFGVYTVQLTWYQAFWTVVLVHFFSNIIFLILRIFFRTQSASEVA